VNPKTIKDEQIEQQIKACPFQGTLFCRAALSRSILAIKKTQLLSYLTRGFSINVYLIKYLNL
jgi:hypothetical protein